MAANHPCLFPPKFNLGRVVATTSAASLGVNLIPFVERHVRGDWGDELDFDDKLRNDIALAEDDRILSKYRVTAEEWIYVITEADRSATTVMLTDEY